MLGKRKAREQISAAERRARIIATADLPAWAEQTTYEIGRCLVEYHKGLIEPEICASEALVGAETLVAILSELSLRLGAGQPAGQGR